MVFDFGAGNGSSTSTTVATNAFTAVYGLTSYISTDEYRQMPTGVDVSQLVRGNPDATEAELGNRIRAASGLVDRHCGQSLNARTVTNETTRVRMDRDGMLTVSPRFFPLIQVTAFSFGWLRTGMTALTDLSNIWPEDRFFQVPIGAGVFSSAGPLQFGGYPRPGGQVRVLYSYVPGFFHTTLAATAAAGATSLQVVDATGALPGMQFTIYDGAQTETCTIGSGYVSGTTLPLATALGRAHNQVGVGASALPANVKTATALLTSTLIQTRGAVALIAPAAGGLSARYTQSGSNRGRGQRPVMDDNVELACDMLTPFVRQPR